MDVTLIGQGANAGIDMQVDASHLALRASLRPLEHKIGGINGGHYSIGMQSGIIAAGIASLAQVYQLRWADASKLFLLKKLVVQCATLTGFAATSLGAPLELILGHGSTANGSGGTPAAPNSISNRMRGSMSPSAFGGEGEIRIATTAALTAATGQTLEPNGIAECMGAPNGTLVQSPPMTLFDIAAQGYPEVLQNGDTLALRTLNPAGTGTWVVCVSMDWAEAVDY